MKNLIIAAVVGTAVMAGTFFFGMKIAPKPVPPAPVAEKSDEKKDGEKVTTAPPDTISLETLRKTSESMMSLNDSLRNREKLVSEREQKAKAKEDELRAERDALDQSHIKFKTLFGEFQNRLQLVEASQLDQLQKQASLYTSMNIDQSIDLIRAMEDPNITKLFSVMDTKPLSKLVSAWKAKYPNDVQRLLHDLDAMGRVLPKEQMALNTSLPIDEPAPVAPAAPAPAPEKDSSTPATPAATSTTSNDAAPGTDTPGEKPSLAPPADPPTAPASNDPNPVLPTPPVSTKTQVTTAATN